MRFIYIRNTFYKMKKNISKMKDDEKIIYHEQVKLLKKVRQALAILKDINFPLKLIRP